VKIRSTISKIATRNPTIETKKPKYDAKRSGISLNAVMPSIAKRSIFENGYFVSPEKRGSRSYSTPV